MKGLLYFFTGDKSTSMDHAEQEPTPRFIIEDMTVESWLDTYANEDEGVSREWIEAHSTGRLDTAKAESRKERFMAGKASGTFNAWVAKDLDGKIIGSTTPFIDETGRQRVGSIYVDKSYHGTGIGYQLMQRVVDWLDAEKPIELEVVTYNERAKAFYRKWGFVEVPGSEKLFEGVMPEVSMIRPAGGRREV
jgi:GNAT superfamily N-acetyltransferase